MYTVWSSQRVRATSAPPVDAWAAEAAEEQEEGDYGVRVVEALEVVVACNGDVDGHVAGNEDGGTTDEQLDLWEVAKEFNPAQDQHAAGDDFEVVHDGHLRDAECRT